MELLTKSRVCQGPGVTEKAKVPVRGGDTPPHLSIADRDVVVLPAGGMY